MALTYDEMGNVIGGSADDLPASTSMFSADYYRAKINEFQTVINSLDSAALIVRYMIDEDIDPELTAELQASIAAYESKKGAFRVAAETLNFAINGANSLGAQLPTINANLSGIPLAYAAAIAAGVAGAAALIVWGRDWIESNRQLTMRAITLGAITDPNKRAAVAAHVAGLDAAANAASGSPLASIAGIVKWVAIGALAWFAFQAYQKHGGGKLSFSND